MENRLSHLKEDKNMENIKRQDRIETVKKFLKVKDFERDKLLEKINEKMLRAEFI